MGKIIQTFLFLLIIVLFTACGESSNIDDNSTSLDTTYEEPPTPPTL